MSMLKKSIIVAVGLGFFSHVMGQTLIFEETFEDGIPATWTIVDEDGLLPADGVNEFDAGWIAFNPDTTNCAASTSYYDPSGQSADYLITPSLSIDTFTKLVWEMRSIDASFPDSYVVLISTTDNNIASFTDTLATVLDETPYWNTRSVRLDEAGYANQDVYVAFKNITEDGYILALNSVQLLGSEFATINNSTADLDFTIYPNPADEFINIKVEAMIQASIYATTGELLIQFSEKQCDISALPQGMYVLEITTSKGIVRDQFIKR